MPLYVIRPDNPPPGTDWIATVPGQYLYDVTGITATLTTSGSAATTAIDATGNGHDGTYHNSVAPQTFVPGLITGNPALETGLTIDAGITEVQVPYVAADWTHAWSIVWWAEMTPGSNPEDYFYVEVLGTSSLTCQILSDKTSGQLQVFGYTGPGSIWQTATNTVPYDGSKHMWALTWDGATLTLYKDSSVVPWTTTGAISGGPFHPDHAYIANSGTGAYLYNGIIDELAVWDAVTLTAGNIAALHTAGGAGIITYASAVLALNPFSYYHLDPGTAIGRQVTLAVTDGTNLVEEIPTGFFQASSLGPYFYSWQPKLNSSSQTPDGSNTTVAIPQLLLPAGYTVAAATLDLGVGDQWSDIAIWWNSDYMDGLNPSSPYEYPPGAMLVYRQEPDLGGNG